MTRSDTRAIHFGSFFANHSVQTCYRFTTRRQKGEWSRGEHYQWKKVSLWMSSIFTALSLIYFFHVLQKRRRTTTPRTCTLSVSLLIPNNLCFAIVVVVVYQTCILLFQYFLNVDWCHGTVIIPSYLYACSATPLFFYSSLWLLRHRNPTHRVIPIKLYLRLYAGFWRLHSIDSSAADLSFLFHVRFLAYSAIYLRSLLKAMFMKILQRQLQPSDKTFTKEKMLELAWQLMLIINLSSICMVVGKILKTRFLIHPTRYK